MLDDDVVFTKEVQPSPLLANGFRRLHEIGECSMVCPDNDGPSEQMLPVLLETNGSVSAMDIYTFVPQGHSSMGEIQLGSLLLEPIAP